MDVLAPFRLGDPALHDVRRELALRIRQGLGEEEAMIQALPAWVAPPARGRAGTVVVVDTGGTNMRAALVELGADGAHRLLAGPFEDKVPRGAGGGEAQAFFERQAALVERLGPPPAFPLGYCFSYPARPEPDGDAVLLRWTKDVAIRGVEGERVGRGLRRALEARGLVPGASCVLNDTVATLCAGAVSPAAPEYEQETIGLIAGTGTNMATFLAHRAFTKLAPAATPAQAERRLAVNLESGNLHPPHLTAWDDELDAASADPGRQRFEKAVSGYWLPRLFREVLPTADLDPDAGTEALVALRARGADDEPTRLASALLERSADLVAAGIAGVCDVLPRGRGVTVVAEGSLFWKTPGYAERVQRVVDRLLAQERAVRVVQAADANFVGSACAALARV